MPLKSTVTPAPLPQVDDSFPALFTADGGRLVALVRKERSGVISTSIVGGTEPTKVHGSHSTYPSCTNMMQAGWTRCPAGTTVTLTQEAP